MINLIDKVLEDIKNDPSKIEKYLDIMAKAGMLKGRVVKLSKVSSEQLTRLQDGGALVIIKGGNNNV